MQAEDLFKEDVKWPTDIQKILNIPEGHRNADQNQYEISSYTSESPSSKRAQLINTGEDG